jgi:ACR3 family arsenite efflux pump ArsB
VQEISKSSKRGLTISLWIVLGGVVLYFGACFLPLLWGNTTGVAEAQNLWRIAFGDQFEVIGDFWTFMGFLAMILVVFSLIVQLFRRQTMKAFMAINLVLSTAGLITIVRLAVIFFHQRMMQLKMVGRYLDCGIIGLGVGFYLLSIALLVVVAGSIVGLARKRRE